MTNELWLLLGVAAFFLYWIYGLDGKLGRAYKEIHALQKRLDGAEKTVAWLEKREIQSGGAPSLGDLTGTTRAPARHQSPPATEVEVRAVTLGSKG